MDEPRHPQSSQIVSAAWFAVAAWATLALFIILFGLAQFQSLRGTWLFEASIVAVVLTAFVCFGAAFIVLAVPIRCQACGKRLFVETSAPKHPRASRVFGMDHWASSVVNIVRHSQCNCMNCGSLIRVASDQSAI